MERWERNRAADLAGIVDEALPGEDLTEDELVALCWEDVDATVVVADPEGRGVAFGVVHEIGERRVGFVQLVAVRPEARRKGIGSALVGAVTAWACEQGATAMSAGGAVPFYVWPGVDVHATPALCLFESLGYTPTGSALNMSFPTAHRAPTPPGLELRRALEEADVAVGLAFVERHWPSWVAETRRAVDHGTCHLALDAGSGADDHGPVVVGFGCHSVNRLGWLGPMGTDPVRRSAGAGNALLGVIATDLMAAGLATVEVSWAGPVRFYAKAAGATVSRSFRTLSRRV